MGEMKRCEGSFSNYVEDDDGNQTYCEETEDNRLATRVRKLYRFLKDTETGCPHQDEFVEVLKDNWFKVDEQKIWAFIMKMDNAGTGGDMLGYLQGVFAEDEPADEIYCE